MRDARVCVIGNSHVAAWRLGMPSVPEWGAAASTDFFAARSDMMRNLQSRDGKLEPTDAVTEKWMRMISGGKAAIDVSAYTHFVVVGLGLNTVRLMEVLRDYRLYAYEADADDDRPFVSSACFEATGRALALASTAVHLAGMLRRLTPAPILIAPQPFPAEGILRDPAWQRADESGALHHVTSVFRTVAEGAGSALECSILWQPDETLARPGLTYARCAEGSVRLGLNPRARHKDDEVLHMNAAFGADMLRRCLAAFH